MRGRIRDCFICTLFYQFDAEHLLPPPLPQAHTNPSQFPHSPPYILIFFPNKTMHYTTSSTTHLRASRTSTPLPPPFIYCHPITKRKRTNAIQPHLFHPPKPHQINTTSTAAMPSASRPSTYCNPAGRRSFPQKRTNCISRHDTRYISDMHTHPCQTTSDLLLLDVMDEPCRV